MAVCNGHIVQESKDKYLEQDFCLLAIKSSLVDYKRNIFENINQIKVFFTHKGLFINDVITRGGGGGLPKDDQ